MRPIRSSATADAPSIALFEPLRLIRAACARWPALESRELLGLLPVDARDGGDPDRQVPLAAVFEILARIVRRVDQTSVPIQLATSTRIDEMGVPGFAIMTAPNGREALMRAARFQRLICAAGAWELRERPEGVTLRWRRGLALDLGHRIANEIVLAELVAYARDLLGAFTPLAIHLRHPAPRDTRVHREFFGCALHFGAEHDEVELPLGLLERTPRSANPAMARYFEAVAEAQGAALGEPALRTRVRSLIQACLPDGEPSAGALARRLGLSVRTLQVRLQDEGTSVRGLLEELRRERALALLEQGETVTAAAFALGFSETSAFSRAFRRWYGRAPRDLLRDESSRLRSGSSA